MGGVECTQARHPPCRRELDIMGAGAVGAVGAHVPQTGLVRVGNAALRSKYYLHVQLVLRTSHMHGIGAWQVP